MKYESRIKRLTVKWAKILTVIGLLTTITNGLSALTREDLSVGQMQNFTFLDSHKSVPDFSFVNGEGRELRLIDFHGKFVLVNLWATWCEPCRREMPSLDRLQAHLFGSDFTVLALSQDRKGPAVVAKFLTDIGATNLAVYVDPTARSARRLGAIGLPTSLLLDREGRIIGHLIGSAEWDSDEAAHLIKSVIREH